MYAEGNVTMRRKDDVQIADKIFENAKEGKGILINSQIKTKIQGQKNGKRAGRSTARERRRLNVSIQKVKAALTRSYCLSFRTHASASRNPDRLKGIWIPAEVYP